MNRRALIFALALLAGLAAACAGEQRADDPQPTISREDRADRPSRLPAEAPPSQQEREQAAALEQDAEPEAAEVQIEQAEAEQAAAQSDQAEPTVAAAGTIQSGWRAGVRADRNVLGDPNAEIVITEWSDYQ